MSLDYNSVLERLDAIDKDLEGRQSDYEQAAEDYHRLIRDFEKRMALTKRQSKGTTETAKKDDALIAIAAADDSLYADLSNAESKYQANKAAIRVLETRVSIGQSLLKSMTRETFQGGQQPEWSGRAVSGVGS